MREILFRGKNLKGEWVYGNYAFTDTNGKQHFIFQNEAFANKVIPETVGQFTGLTDKNGTKIFEGDIIKAMMDYGPAGFYERIVPIEWLNDVGYQWQYFDISTIEVIGNIHDNPELLGGNYCG